LRQGCLAPGIALGRQWLMHAVALGGRRLAPSIVQFLLPCRTPCNAKITGALCECQTPKVQPKVYLKVTDRQLCDGASTPSAQKIRSFRPSAWVTENVKSHQVSDDHHLGRHPFDGEVDSHQSSNGPPLTPSRSGSPTLRVMEDLMDRQ
ncbi:hypothetical protein HAX54_012736, partial [Datura stramonium]|nr:hypothetical protein [Datura stramonium]